MNSALVCKRWQLGHFDRSPCLLTLAGGNKQMLQVAAGLASRHHVQGICVLLHVTGAQLCLIATQDDGKGAGTLLWPVSPNQNTRRLTLAGTGHWPIVCLRLMPLNLRARKRTIADSVQQTLNPRPRLQGTGRWRSASSCSTSSTASPRSTPRSLASRGRWRKTWLRITSSMRSCARPPRCF